MTSPVNGLAGLAGPAIRPIGLGQVKQFRELLSKDIIGVGGVDSGQAVRDYQRVGATAVQVTSAYLSRGGDIFRQILEENGCYENASVDETKLMSLLNAVPYLQPKTLDNVFSSEYYLSLIHLRPCCKTMR